MATSASRSGLRPVGGRARALELAERIDDAEDREILLADLAPLG